MLEGSLLERETSATGQLREAVGRCRDFPAVVQVPMECEPLAWLEAQPASERLVWSDRDNKSVTAGVGKAASIEAEPGESTDTVIQRCRTFLDGRQNLRFFGGFAFCRDQAPVDDWHRFGLGKFWLPRLVHDGRRLACTVLNASDVDRAVQAVDDLTPVRARRRESLTDWTDRHDVPDRSGWAENVREVCQLLASEVLEKVVLARMATFTFANPLNPVELIGRLIQETQACFGFCFQLDPHVAFVGATPERLMRRTGDNLISDVLAGTRPRSHDAQEDRRLADELLSSGKDQLEHDIVRKSIRQRLHRYVDDLQVDSRAAVLRLARKQHLYSRVQASIHRGVTDGELLDRLHPTPAVGGYPTENALSEIARLEPFHRGWYAAPIGWISRDEAEFVVAIRSGLLHGNSLSLYSGAGIVTGSTADNEWQEIENKISDFLEVLRPNCHHG